MEHIAIDLGARHSHIVKASQTGEVTTPVRVRTQELLYWLSKQARSHVVMEACTQSPAVARGALAAGHRVTVVPGHLVRLLGVGARGIKTDGRDAEALALASVRNPNLPSVHLRSEQSQQRRELIAARATLVDARRRLATSVKSWLRGQLMAMPGRASSKHFSKVVREQVEQHGQQVSVPLSALLTTYDQLTDQIDQLDEQCKKLVAEDQTCQRLMTVPGVGPQVALAFTTHLDCAQRFSTAGELASYLALVPGEATTGGKVVRTSTIKAGPRYLKALLVQAAWVMYRTRPSDPAVLWMQRIADKRGKRIAVTALARKLATVLWSMWKHGTCYQPDRASTVRQPDLAEQTAQLHSIVKGGSSQPASPPR